jgi:hypothetical protein
METMESVATGAMRELPPCSWTFGFSLPMATFLDTSAYGYQNILDTSAYGYVLMRPLGSPYEARWGNQEHGPACWMARVQGSRDEQLFLLQQGQRSHLGLVSPHVPTKDVPAVEMSSVYSTERERERERETMRDSNRATSPCAVVDPSARPSPVTPRV